MKQCLIKYQEAQNYILEGDVLLFRGTSLASLAIQSLGQGYYSHVGMASWCYDQNGEKVALECVEFREWIGSRAINLRNYVIARSGTIDVFRPIPEMTTYTYNCKMRKAIPQTIIYNGKKITDEFRTLTGLPYGWARIFWLLKFHLLGIRLLSDSQSYDDTLQQQEYYPVCSTIVSHLFTKHYVDLIKFRSDSRMEPSDLARSPVLNYLFTLTH